MKYIDKNNFCVEITHESKEIIKNWWYKNGYPERLFSHKAFYGHHKGKIYTSNCNIDLMVNEISFEDFKNNILNKTYEIF